jgi:hypothetical protein
MGLGHFGQEAQEKANLEDELRLARQRDTANTQHMILLKTQLADADVKRLDLIRQVHKLQGERDQLLFHIANLLTSIDSALTNALDDEGAPILPGDKLWSINHTVGYYRRLFDLTETP